MSDQILTTSQLAMFPRLIRDPFFSDEDIASVLDIEVVHFLNAFKKATKMSFREWRELKGITTILTMGARDPENKRRIQEAKFSIKATEGLKDFKKDIKTVARGLGLSDKAFRKKVQQDFGVKAEDIRDKQKVLYAKEKLRDPNILIKTIAEDIGFKSAMALRDLFFKHTNMRPSEYREKYRDKPKEHTAEEKQWLEDVENQLRKANLSFKQIAQKSGMQTYGGFTQRFERLTGLTPTEWRETHGVIIPTAEIIRQVKGHIQNPDVTISQIAGIYDISASALSRRFKRSEGVSVEQYRINAGVFADPKKKIKAMKERLRNPRLSGATLGKIYGDSFGTIDAYFKRHVGRSMKQWRSDKGIPTLTDQPEWVLSAKKMLAEVRFDEGISEDEQTLFARQAFRQVADELGMGFHSMLRTFEKATGMTIQQWMLLASVVNRSRDGVLCLSCREMFNLPAEGVEPRLAVPEEPTYALPYSDPSLHC